MFLGLAVHEFVVVSGMENDECSLYPKAALEVIFGELGFVFA